LPDELLVWTPLLSTPLPPDLLWPEGYEACGVSRRPVRTYAGAAFPRPLLNSINNGRALCAHNAFGFDALIWHAKGFPAPPAWLDTLPDARAAGLPGELDEIGKRLVGKGKHDGAALVKQVCRPNAKGQFPAFTPDKATRLAQYNVADVLLLAKLYAESSGSGEPGAVALDRLINERGIAFDADLARALIRLDEQSAAEAGQAVEKATSGKISAKDLCRGKFLLEWLRSEGVDIPNLQRPTIEECLRSEDVARIPPGATVHTVLTARLATAKITAAKLKNALASLSPDGRLRDQFVYHGAHTGRWSGRGVQIQNLPRSDDHLKDIPALLAKAKDPSQFAGAMPPGVTVAAAVSSLIRSCLRAGSGNVFCVADFASIEARGVAWCAGEKVLLKRFAAGEDVYCDLAGQLFGYEVTRQHERERKIGKIAILGCGYGMSARKFAEHAREHGIDLSNAGVSAEDVVEGYRDAFPRIAGQKEYGTRREGGLWQDVEDAARFALTQKLDQPVAAGRCEFSANDRSLIIQLPSGRKIRYRNARVENRVPAYTRNRSDSPSWQSQQSSTTIHSVAMRQLMVASSPRTSFKRFAATCCSKPCSLASARGCLSFCTYTTRS
jgi:DNA polymerase